MRSIVKTICDAKDSFSRFLGDAWMVVENPGNGTDAYLRLASDIIDRWGQEPIFLEGLPQNQVLIRESQEKNAIMRKWGIALPYSPPDGCSLILQRYCGM